MWGRLRFERSNAARGIDRPRTDGMLQPQRFSSVHIITLESNLTGLAPLKVTAPRALGKVLKRANCDHQHVL